MRIGRFELGVWKHEERRYTLKELLTFELDVCGAGCHIWTFGPFYFTILAGDCLENKDETC